MMQLDDTNRLIDDVIVIIDNAIRLDDSNRLIDGAIIFGYILYSAFLSKSSYRNLAFTLLESQRAINVLI